MNTQTQTQTFIKNMKLTSDEFYELLDTKFISVSESQYYKINKFEECNIGGNLLILKNETKTKIKITLQSSNTLLSVNTINLFFKKKTLEQIDLEEKEKEEKLKNDTFNSYSNVEFWD